MNEQINQKKIPSTARNLCIATREMLFEQMIFAVVVFGKLATCGAKTSPHPFGHKTLIRSILWREVHTATHKNKKKCVGIGNNKTISE